tara:strand:- start:998 stop:1270 length:273 start_codon:yes stop_codon:yes gene_type:complete
MDLFFAIKKDNRVPGHKNPDDPTPIAIGIPQAVRRDRQRLVRLGLDHRLVAPAARLGGGGDPASGFDDFVVEEELLAGVRVRLFPGGGDV